MKYVAMILVLQLLIENRVFPRCSAKLRSDCRGVPQALKVGLDIVALAHGTYVELLKPMFYFCTGKSTNLLSQRLDRNRTTKVLGNTKCLVPRFHCSYWTRGGV